MYCEYHRMYYETIDSCSECTRIIDEYGKLVEYYSRKGRESTGNIIDGNTEFTIVDDAYFINKY